MKAQYMRRKPKLQATFKPVGHAELSGRRPELCSKTVARYQSSLELLLQQTNQSTEILYVYTVLKF
jgi:predicted transglutaminase-like cysteine proteinase